MVVHDGLIDCSSDPLLQGHIVKGEIQNTTYVTHRLIIVENNLWAGFRHLEYMAPSHIHSPLSPRENEVAIKVHPDDNVIQRSSGTDLTDI